MKFFLAAAAAVAISLAVQAHAEMPIDPIYSDQDNDRGANMAAQFNADNQRSFDANAAAEDQRERDNAMQRRMDDMEVGPVALRVSVRAE